MAGEQVQSSGETSGWFGAGGLAATAAVALLAVGAAASTGSFLVAGAAAELSAGLLVWLAVLLTGVYRRRAAAERLENARLETLAQEGRQRLFEAQGRVGEAEAEATLVRFEQVGGVAFGLALALTQGGLAWGLWRFYGSAPEASVQGDLGVAALLAAASFGLLLLGRYGFALAARGLSGADAGGRRASAASLATFVAAVGQAGVHSFELAGIDRLGLVFVALLVLLAVESLLLVVLEAYRPRRKGVVVRPPYDSRLLGLLTAPSEIARSIARSVDYQFGFAISQTWFYRFLERWVVPLTVFAVAAFWLMSALVVVQDYQQGVRYRFGSAAEQPLQPGLHLKLPWPFDQVVAIPARRVQRLVTGEGQEAEGEDEEEEPNLREMVVSWTETKVQDEEDLVLLARRGAGDSADAAEGVNLVAVSATIQFRVADVLEHVRNVAEPSLLLKLLAERELSLLLASADLDELLQSRGREARALQERLAERARQQALGVEIVSVELTDLHPPVEVGRAFESVTAAVEKRETEVQKALAAKARLATEASLESARIRREAVLTAAARVDLTRVEARRLSTFATLDAAAPGVFRLLALLDAQAAGSAGARKIVLGRGQALVELDLEDKVRIEDMEGAGLFDEPATPAAEEGN